MNNPRVFAVSVLLAAIVGCSQQNSPLMENGTIVFAEKEDGGGKTCGVPTVPDPEFELGEEFEVSMDSDKYGCDNDIYNYVRFENVPSATKIQLVSNYCYNNVSEWIFHLSTIVHPTTTGWLYIGSLSSFNEGGIVTRGVRLDKKTIYNPGDFINEFSCLRITRSP